ncbi:MAG: hypothetical protein Q9159_002215 [Coniocarpon cinnabarinum]
MSSPTQTASTFPGRNPRRRGRKDGDDNGTLRSQPLRKRPKTRANGDVSSSDPHLTNGHATAPSTQDLPVRQRANALDSKSIDILSRNENFAIGKLPSLPKELRNNQEGDASSPATKSVRLPTPTRQDDLLSFGALVHPGSRNGTGLLVIHPRSGKVTYWENVDNAKDLGLLPQRRASTDGSVGLYSGETVTNVENAFIAGFVVTTSSNRVAQLQLRDSQSRPSINVQFLRAPRSNGGGSFLGGFLSALTTGGLLKDVTTTRIQSSSIRGPVYLFVGSRHGQLQKWMLNWSDPPVLLREWNQHEVMYRHLRDRLESQMPSTIQSIDLLDIAFLSADHGQQPAFDIDLDGAMPVRLVGLYSFAGASFRSYAISSITLQPDGSCDASGAINLSSYAAPLTPPSRWKPKLCVASPHLTCFVFFEKAITVVSLASVQSVDAVLVDQSDVFQDTTYLKEQDEFRIVGAAAESRNEAEGQSTAVILIPSIGALQVGAEEPSDFDSALSRHPVSIQSKIEQAILYGARPSNPFDLSRRPEFPLNRAEVEDAVTTISNKVLTSAYPSLTHDFATVEQQIDRRIHVIELLAKHIKDNYSQLSRLTRWMLLWDREQLGVAHVVNDMFHEQTEMGNASTSERRNRKILLPEMIERMHEDLRSISMSEWNNTGHFRHYLLYDTDKMSNVLNWTYNGVYHLAQIPEVADSDQLLQIVHDATRTACAIIETALQIREEFLWLYDLEEEVLEDGILAKPELYEELPCPWTSTFPQPTKIHELVSNAQTIISDAAEDEKTDSLLRTMAAENPQLVSAWCLIAQEHIRWTASRPPGSRKHQYEDSAMLTFKSDLSKVLMPLALLDQAAAGLAIAEKYEVMDVLTTLVREESGSLVRILNALDQAPHQREALKVEMDRLARKDETSEKIKNLEQRIAKYHREFGYAFTNPYYGALIARHSYGSLLKQASTFPQDVTTFLRAETTRRPLSWINDILSARDYAMAGHVLVNDATTAEQKAWNRGVELGFAKLAILAADEEEHHSGLAQAAPGHLNDDTTRPGSHWHDRRRQQSLYLLSLQNQLWTRVRHLTYNALDEESKVDLLMEALGDHLRKHSRSRLSTLLSVALANLIADDALGAESLVDILTLINDDNAQEPVDIGDDVFFMAIAAVRNDATLSDERRDVLTKVCWRRAMLSDDWADINRIIAADRMGDDAVRELLSSTVLYRTFLEGFKATVERHKDSQEGGGMPNGDANDAPLAYFEDMPTPNPSQCLAAGTTFNDWALRFGEDRREIGEPLAAECQIEGKWLERSINKNQLERWWETCRQIAMEDVREMDENTQKDLA